MPPIAVVDASVLVSAFLFPDSVPGKILKLADQAAFTMNLYLHTCLVRCDVRYLTLAYAVPMATMKPRFHRGAPGYDG